MKIKLTIVTNQPTPYRRELFQELGSFVDLRVIYRRIRESNRLWSTPPGSRYSEVFLTREEPAPGFAWGLIEACRLLRALRVPTDVYVLGGYDSVLPTLALICLGLITRTPVLLWSGTTSHSVSNHSRPAGLWRRVVMRHVRGVLAYSTKAADFARSHGAKRVLVIGNAHRSLGAPRPSRPSGAVFRLVYVGQLTERKGVDRLLEGLELVASSCPVRLVICGDGALRHQADRARHTDVRGWQDNEELAEVINTADALVFPSQTDPWGLVVGEAMSLGVPVVLDARSGCVPDLADERTAIVGEMGSPEQVAAEVRRAISVIATDPGLVERAMRRSVEFSGEAVAARFSGAVSVLARRSSG